MNSPSLKQHWIPVSLLATSAAGVLIAGLLAKNIPSGERTVSFDPSKGQICGAKDLCDPHQMSLGMHDKTGQISLESPIGKALLQESANNPQLTREHVLEVMTGLNKKLSVRMPVTVLEFHPSGLAVMVPPGNVGQKSAHLPRVFVSNGKDCWASAFTYDGQLQPFAIKSGSHAGNLRGCGGLMDATAKEFSNDFKFTPSSV